RRRHTRFSRDWSSDVCSSDLLIIIIVRTVTGRPTVVLGAKGLEQAHGLVGLAVDDGAGGVARLGGGSLAPDAGVVGVDEGADLEIGRASCRGRVEIWWGAGWW